MFKLASFTSASHSAAEKFLFKECLMKEIQFLNEGYAIDVKGQSYFIQCRLIQFVFDTKEIGHSLFVYTVPILMRFVHFVMILRDGVYRL